MGKFLVFGVLLLHVCEKVDVSLNFFSGFEEHVLWKLSVVGLSDLLEQIGVVLRLFKHKIKSGNSEYLGLNLVDLFLFLLLLFIFQLLHNLIIVNATLSFCEDQCIDLENILALEQVVHHSPNFVS